MSSRAWLKSFTHMSKAKFILICRSKVNCSFKSIWQVRMGCSSWAYKFGWIEHDTKKILVELWVLGLQIIFEHYSEINTFDVLGYPGTSILFNYTQLNVSLFLHMDLIIIFTHPKFSQLGSKSGVLHTSISNNAATSARYICAYTRKCAIPKMRDNRRLLLKIYKNIISSHFTMGTVNKTLSMEVHFVCPRLAYI